ncbi:hypothetical protein HYW43_02150 [Candidatus Daviesbacteria bacterium]|nr:hypothetical protein [Candidatus Daviesbacteria bacterium]
MKYDTQLTELKNLLPTAKSILIALPTNASIDTLAAGLALFLTLETAAKQVSVVSDDTIKVDQAHLFGVDHIQKNLPSTEGGNLTLTLEGVAASDNTVPALEKLDWYAEANNLNLVFHVLPGQTFQPSKIVPRYQGSGFNLIIVVGAVNLNALGNVYTANTQAFSGTHIINIDNQVSNSSFGQTNVVDTNAASVSEIMGSVVADLGFNLDADTASNLLAGIFESTKNLTDSKSTADTFMAVANCLRAGGKKPDTQSVPTFDWNALAGQSQSSQISQPASEFTVPPVMQPTPQISPVDVGDHTQSAQAAPQSQPQPSLEERPVEEGVISETVEPEWLTPKIFKGSSLG